MIRNPLAGCPLFSGIAPQEAVSLLHCLSARQRQYAKDTFLFRAEEPARSVGVLLSGSVHIIQEDYWGNRTILAHAGPGELFGEAFSCAQVSHLPVSVVAAENAVVLLLNCRKLLTVCPSACTFHTRVLTNLLQILAQKNILLTQKIGYLSKRTTREKVTAFLSAQALQCKSSRVTIPFNRQELADYLCVERSALSRELSAMKKDGLLDYRRNQFILRGQP